MLHDLCRRWKSRVIAFSAAGGLLALLLNAAPAAANPAGRAVAGPPAVSRGSLVLRPIGSAPEIPAGARAAGAPPASAGVDFDVALRPRSPRALQVFATAVSTPGSAQYRHFLNTAQFAARFGQTEAAAGRVDAALRAAGLAPGQVSANGLVIPVATTVGRASAGLHTRFERYKLGSGRLALANTSAPRLSATVAPLIQAIIGLDNLITVPSGPPTLSSLRTRGGAGLSAVRLPAMRPRAAQPHTAQATASGPRPCPGAGQVAARTRAWTYDQLARAYSLQSLYSKNLAGAGTTIALFELQTWSATDVRNFQTCYRTAAPVTPVNVDGGATGRPGEEATLDIETALALAPQASVLVYDAPGASYAMSLLDDYTRIIDDDQAQVVSTSYGVCELALKRLAPGLAASENTVLQQAATEGISVFAAAGDTGSAACYQSDRARKELSVQDPAAQPFVTAVGGTDLTALGPAPTERVWNEARLREGAGAGGISSMWAKPPWQAGPGVISRYSSGKPCQAGRAYCREVPDVSASADPTHGYVIIYKGDWALAGGTSAAAPLWAALLADIDSQTSPSTHGGFLSPQLYALPPGTLNDIRVGSDDYTGTHHGRYPAARGFDMASGLGSPIATRLASALRPPVTFVDNPGTGAPPGIMGPYSTQAFGADSQSLDTFVSGIAGPTGPLAFSPQLEHLKVGHGWNGWSNGYAGDVFYTGSSPGLITVTVSLPARTVAFCFYGQPKNGATFDLSATAQNRTSSGPLTVGAAGGARYLGFHSGGGTYLDSVTISCDEAFAIGELGIAKG